MEFKAGKRVKVRGRYENFTDHLDGCVVEIVYDGVDDQGYVYVVDESGANWFVRAEDLSDV